MTLTFLRYKMQEYERLRGEIEVLKLEVNALPDRKDVSSVVDGA